MATGGNNRINFQVGFNVDKSGLNEVSQAFQKLQNVKFTDSFKGTKELMQQIKRQAMDVESALKKAFNPNLNSFNLSSFKQQLSSMGLDLNTVYNNFSRLGVTGQNAFNTMSTSLLTTNLNLKQTSSFVKNIGTTLMNTVKWTVASTAIRSFTSSISQAFTYVKSLDSSLNDIRIVTKDSADLMANFAVQANKAASLLGRSTLDYTKAALTFYQQGLDDLAVQARTLAVLKAQNITGAGSLMADYLTAVWNGYKIANEEAETYVDKLAAVADSSASNMSLIAIAMSKVSSAANILGVGVDSLAAQIATIVATTRLAPLSVGNALKTVYARINDISTGADDAEVSLGNYSKAMKEVGVSVLDSNGRLRNTGDVINEVGEKWSSLSREQQIFLARTMAGQRQYNKLITLFDNWSKYTDLVTVSMLSQGATELKNAIYMESLAAHTEKLGAAQLRLKSSMVDSDSYKRMIDVATQGVTVFANFILSIGGGGNALLMLGSTLASVFSGVIASEINKVVVNMQNVKYNALIVADAVRHINEEANVPIQYDTAKNLLAKIKDIYGQISNLQRLQLNNLLVILTRLQEKYNVAKNLLDNAIQLRKTLANSQGIVDINSATGIKLFNANMDKANAATEELLTPIEMIKLSASNLKNDDVMTSLNEGAKKLEEALGKDNLQVQELDRLLKQATDTSNPVLIQRIATKIAEVFQQIRQNIETTDPKNMHNLVVAADDARTSFKGAADETQRLLDIIRSLFNINNLIQGIAGIGQLTSGFRSLTNITKIWKNENLSAGEKVLQTFTSLSMGLTMLIRGFQKIGPMFSSIGSILSKYTATLVANRVASVKLAAASGSVAAAKLIETGAVNSATAAWVSHIATLMPYIAVIGGLIALVYGFTRELAAQDEAIEKASEAVKEADESYKSLKNSINDFNSSISSYEEMQKALLEIDKDTNLWNQKLRESNLLVLELIQKFPELANAVENVNGALKFSDSGIAELQKQMQEALDMASITKIAARNNYNNAQAEKQNTLLTDQINRLLINTSDNLYRDPGEGYKTYIDPQEVNKIATAVYNFQKGNVGEQYTNLEEFLAGEFKDLAEIFNSISKDELNAFNLLGKILNENEKANELAYEDAVRNNSKITESEFYKNSNALDQDTIVKILGKGLAQGLKDRVLTWKKTLNKPWGTDEASDQTWGQDVLNLLNKITGKNYRWTDDSIQNSGADRVFEVIEEGAEQAVTYSRDYIASMMAARDALADLGVATTNVEKAFKDFGKELYKGVAGGIKDLILGNDFSSMTRKELTDQEAVGQVEKWATDNDKVIAQMGYTGDDAAQKFAEAYKKQQESSLSILENSLEGKLKSIQSAFTRLDIIDNDKVSLDIVNALNNLLTQALESGDILNFNIVERLLGSDKIDISNIPEIEQLSTEFLKGSINAVQLKDKLSELVPGFDIADSELDAFINYLLKVALGSKTAVQSYKDLYDTTNKLSLGSVISEEDLKKITNADLNLRRFFIDAALGGYQLAGSAELLKKAVNDIAIQKFREEISKNVLQYNKLDNVNLNKVDNSKEGVQNKIDLMSLFDVDPAIIGDFSKRLSENFDFSLLQEINAKFQELGLTLEDLKQKQLELTSSTFLYLMRIASTANNLDELNKLVELGKLSWQGYSTAYLGLEEANDLKGLDATKLKDFSKYLQKAATGSDELANSLEEDDVAAKIVAKSIMKMNNGVETLSKNFKNWSDILQNSSKDSQEYAEAANGTVEALSQLLDINSDYIPISFVEDAENISLIEEAAKGSLTAIDLLKAKLEEQLVIQIAALLGIDTLQMQTQFNELLTYLDGYSPDPIEIGTHIDDIDDTLFINGLNEMIQAGGYTAEQVNAMLDQIGYEPVFATLPQPVETTGYLQITYSTVEELPGKTTYIQNYDTGLTLAFQTLPQTKITTRTLQGNPYTYTQYVDAMAMSSNGKTPVIKSLVKKPRGGSNNKSSRNSGGDKSKGGGGSKSPKKGSAKKPDRAKKLLKSKLYENTEKLLTIYNPYLRITKQYERQSLLIDKIQKQEDKLSGKDRLKNLTAQNTALKKQNDILKKRQAISDDADKKGTTANLKKQLEDTFKFFKDKKGKSLFGFDADGQIKNVVSATNYAVRDYNKKVAAIEKEANIRWNTAQNDYNKIVSAWNKKSASEQEELNKKAKKLSKGVYDNWLEYQKHLLDETKESIKKEADDRKDAAKKLYDNRLNLLKEYQERLKEDKLFYEEYAENIRQIIENQLSKILIKVQLKVDQGLFERQYLDFRDKFVKRIGEKDFRNKAKSATRNLFSYLDSGLLAQTINAMNLSRSNYKLFKNKRTKFINNDASLTDDDFKALGITREAWADTKRADRKRIIDEQISKSYEQLKEFTGSVEEKLIQMQEYADEIKETLLSAYDLVKNNQDDILEQYDRINSVILYGVKLSLMVFGDKAYAKAEAFEQAQLDNDKAEMKRLETYKQYWQKIYNTTEDLKLKETALNNLRDFSDKLQSQIEKVIELSDKLLQTKINKTIDEALEKFATLGTEGNRSEWDHLKEFDDAFLDVAETRMGIRLIERLYDEVGDSLEGDVDQQKKFNEFQKKQINLLKSKNNLTQYDLDRAKAALEVEKAKYALLQAREKKVELRLRRDSQGNYTYQFVAQEEALEDKTADLEEKIANLYKLDKDQWINGVDAMQDRTINFIQTITQLQQEYNKAMLAGEVERAEKIKARIEMLLKENDRMWKAMSENLDVILKVYLVDSYGDAMGQTFSSTEEALNSMKENVDIFDAQAREYINAINGQGGLLEVYKTTTDTIQGFINEYNTNILDALKADEIVAAADGSIELVQGITELASAEQDMINGYEKVLTKTQEQIKSITKLLLQADDFMDTLRLTGGVLSDVLASYKVVQGQNAFDQTKFKDAITSGDFTTTDLSRLQGHINDLIDIFKDAIDTTQMASGGYTGDWGSTGKLAFLHEKELVLNAEDTSNLLAAVQSVRAMTLGMTADNYLQSLANGQTAMLSGLSNTQLDQNVHIEANFPNVRDHLEIERAFDNLINIASMHAAKKQ